MHLNASGTVLLFSSMDFLCLNCLPLPPLLHPLKSCTYITVCPKRYLSQEGTLIFQVRKSFPLLVTHLALCIVFYCSVTTNRMQTSWGQGTVLLDGPSYTPSASHLGWLHWALLRLRRSSSALSLLGHRLIRSHWWMDGSSGSAAWLHGPFLPIHERIWCDCGQVQTLSELGAPGTLLCLRITGWFVKRQTLI